MRMMLTEMIDRARPMTWEGAARIADACRFQLGLNYQQTLDRVRRQIPEMTPAKWDALLYEADWHGAR